MAHYSYKDVCFAVPEHYISNFKEVYGREFDGDPNYDGDYWNIVGDWINDMKQRLELLDALEAAGVDNWSGFDLAIENLGE